MGVFIFQNACPRCRGDVILATFLKMKEGCRACGYEYEADSSGAMALNYAFGALLSFPIFFAVLLRGGSPLMAIGVPALVNAVLAPFMVRYSRLAWAHVEFMLKPSK